MRLTVAVVVDVPGGCPIPVLEPRGISQWEAFLSGYKDFTGDSKRRLGLDELAYLLKCLSYANGTLTDVLNVGDCQVLVAARFVCIDDIVKFREAFESQYTL